MSVDFWYVVIILSGVLIVASSVMGIYKTIRTRAIAKKAGILKTRVVVGTLIIHLAVAALAMYVGINRMNEAQKYLSLVNKYEGIIDSLDSIVDVIGDDFQQVSLQASEKTPAEKLEEIKQKLARYKEAGKANRIYATFMCIMAISELVSAVEAFWYITEEGIMLPSFKVPEPFNAKLNGDKIEISFEAKFKNADKIITFKATPENLAVFGRFISWEQEQIPQETNIT